jgi:hypothetical protein
MFNMRRALVIGINYYEHISKLHGCVDDAHSVKSALERHADGSVNFGVKLLTGTGSTDVVNRHDLKQAVRELFSGENGEIALLYFAGHGHIETTGGYLCCSDCINGDDGLPLSEIMTLANESKFANRIIILDSCYSGIVGSRPISTTISEISNGVTILTASTAEQYADEDSDGGVFTNLLVDALSGAAANLLGEITPGSVYAHIDQSLGTWTQRPVFKTNVQKFISLKRIQPAISLEFLQMLPVLFPEAGFEFSLDPSFEPESDNPNPDNTKIFAILQRYNRVNLAVPIGAPHPYFAAMQSKTMKLTALGEHYRRLAQKGQI